MTIVANTRRITAACAALAALLICAKAAQPLKLDFLWAGLCLVGAVYFVFRSR